MMQEGICFSRYSLKLYIVVRCYLRLAIVLVREDVEVSLHACQTKAEHFWLCVWTKCYLGKTAAVFGNNIRIICCTWLCKMST